MTTPSVKRTATTESLVELESERRAVHRTVVCKIVVHVPRASTHHVEREGNSKKDHVSPLRGDEINEKRIARYPKGVPSAKCSIRE